MAFLPYTRGIRCLDIFIYTWVGMGSVGQPAVWAHSRLVVLALQHPNIGIKQSTCLLFQTPDMIPTVATHSVSKSSSSS